MTITMQVPPWIFRRDAAPIPGTQARMGHQGLPRTVSGDSRHSTGKVALSRAALAQLLDRVSETERPRRVGLGVNPAAIVTQLSPQLLSLAQQLSDYLEPKVKQIAAEDVAPTLGLYSGMALLAAGVLSGVIGAFFASRRAGVRGR